MDIWANYNPAIFDKRTIEGAKAIILTPDGVHNPEERWALETEYLWTLMGSRVPPRSRVLDFGCGIGRLAKLLIERAECSVIGVDISQTMMAMSLGYVNSRKFIPTAPYVFDVLIDFGVRVDVAVAVWTLQHCPDITDAIGRIKAALVPGGILLVLNAAGRFIPIIGAGWADDQVDVAQLLREDFRQVSIDEVDREIIPSPPAFWGVFEKE